MWVFWIDIICPLDVHVLYGFRVEECFCPAWIEESYFFHFVILQLVIAVDVHFIAWLFRIVSEHHVALCLLGSKINLTVSLVLDGIVFASFVVGVVEYIGDEGVSFTFYLGCLHLPGTGLIVQIWPAHDPIYVFLRLCELVLLVESNLGCHICVQMPVFQRIVAVNSGV